MGSLTSKLKMMSREQDFQHGPSGPLSAFCIAKSPVSDKGKFSRSNKTSHKPEVFAIIIDVTLVGSPNMFKMV